jgi:2-polyprenyl-3-methyl-5-hydroxy-6-metoxy-1,4-benzoquinol methylase
VSSTPTDTFTGERLPGGGDAEFGIDMERHVAAYRYAAERAAGRSVLDAGCGEGYGSAFLARHAARVVGVDRDEAIAIASARYRDPRLVFRALDLMQLPSLAERFDLVASFQVIEHLPDPAGFLGALKACTAPGGTLLVTTPNRLMTVSENPYHLREWTAPEMAALVAPILPGAVVLGMNASERVLAYEKARGEQIRRILRLDPLNLRRFIPEAVIRVAFARLARLVRRRVGAAGALPTVGPDDFGVRGDDLARALDLVVVWEAGSA